MGLSKVFECLNHQLLIAKMSAYDSSGPALKLIYSYLNERQQRVKINGSFSTLKQNSLSRSSPRLGFGTLAFQYIH